MTMQMVMGEIKFAPSRDIVYIYPDVIRNAVDRLEDAPFKPLHDMLKEKGVTLDDLQQAVDAYCRFLAEAHENPEKSMWDVLGDCGWHDCKPEAQIAFMFYVGTLTGGIFFKGIRDVTVLGEESMSTVQSLIDVAQAFTVFATASKRWRWYYKTCKLLRRLFLKAKGVTARV